MTCLWGVRAAALTICPATKRVLCNPSVREPCPRQLAKNEPILYSRVSFSSRLDHGDLPHPPRAPLEAARHVPSREPLRAVGRSRGDCSSYGGGFRHRRAVLFLRQRLRT